MIPIRRIAYACALVLVALVVPAAPALAQEAPDVLVKRVSQEALDIIRTDPKVQAGDKSHIRDLIEAKIAPHFDMERMTALAVGRGWRQATPEQKKRLADEFKTLLIRTYSNALDQYRYPTLRYLPLRADANATDVTVLTEVIRPGQQPVGIDYSMEKTPSGWKAYDVIVAGVSLVTNYRDEFTQQIQQGGIDALIKALETKNAAPVPAK
ncbi:MAG TPA: ABC transporter substrate-binding protein [Casimicrobiaceae bacterium]